MVFAGCSCSSYAALEVLRGALLSCACAHTLPPSLDPKFCKRLWNSQPAVGSSSETNWVIAYHVRTRQALLTTLGKESLFSIGL
jgi:hypothetical protein